jgi:amidase
VLTRTVRDTALFYAEAEKFYKSKRVPAMGLVNTPLKKRLRIAFLENHPEGKPGHQDEDTRNTQVQTAKLLTSLGHQVEEIPFPIDADMMITHFLHYYGFMAYMLTHWSGFTLKSKVNHSVLEPFTSGLSQLFKKNPGRLVPGIRAMRRMGAHADALFEKYDVVMSPVLSHKTPPIGYFSPELPYEEVSKRAVNFATYTGLNNVTGSPAISLPLGTDSNNMPMGVHFSAAYGNDRLLLELALELEAAQPFKHLYQV